MIAAAPQVGVPILTGALPDEPPTTPTGIYSCEGGEMLEGSLSRLDEFQEKVRLRKHCQYFSETMNEPLNGKKLGFISQEIGREINTLGSKACQAEIQQWVVRMKDELEKIKEQLANIL